MSWCRVNTEERAALERIWRRMLFAEDIAKQCLQGGGACLIVSGAGMLGSLIMGWSLFGMTFGFFIAGMSALCFCVALRGAANEDIWNFVDAMTILAYEGRLSSSSAQDECLKKQIKLFETAARNMSDVKVPLWSFVAKEDV